MKETLLKGAVAEEALRNYFLSIGYYVTRGCKFKYSQFDVTDIDLLLYGKSSSLNRERVNVDIKNKKTPQALERIFWTKGLQQILGLESAIVVTSDMRPDVREFGLQNKVGVLDGHFLSRLVKSTRSYNDRINEEDFLSDLERDSLGRLGGDWRGRYEKAKSRLISSLNFDGANAWLNDIHYYFSQAASENVSPTAWRAIYVNISQLLICVDYILREHITAEHEQRKLLLENGFRYGSAGKDLTLKVGRMAAALVGSVVSDQELGKTLEIEIQRQAEEVRADILAEFFSKAGVQSSLFDLAKLFESAAFASTVPVTSSLPGVAQAIIGVLSDFFEIDRKLILK
ncbi:hypothetical protein N5J43_01550 [Pseudomonas nicosulfuronedens]|uniref:hypothetical protein n=1 Tax=Pseudomonas nicosulfuronedens TaxID=2571105 RepID=UPI002447F89B|nr:hypothetical protein [Pseudomonas nicosulfuronedens]MDH1007569.1 hypothetical protein [Pseudomonas nicosulfuronedens]MDH1977614.1 hypothetical protein [Pseudomonas nicosulfuronedens]MDH2025786.1 hypothetical protein [Pseudomonas nicosulfuronedens]